MKKGVVIFFVGILVIVAIILGSVGAVLLINGIGGIATGNTATSSEKFLSAVYPEYGDISASDLKNIAIEEEVGENKYYYEYSESANVEKILKDVQNARLRPVLKNAKRSDKEFSSGRSVYRKITLNFKDGTSKSIETVRAWKLDSQYLLGTRYRIFLSVDEKPETDVEYNASIVSEKEFSLPTKEARAVKTREELCSFLSKNGNKPDWLDVCYPSADGKSGTQEDYFENSAIIAVNFAYAEDETDIRVSSIRKNGDTLTVVFNVFSPTSGSALPTNHELFFIDVSQKSLEGIENIEVKVLNLADTSRGSRAYEAAK